MRIYQPKRRTNKYGNAKCELDGFLFDSQKERDRYAELKLLEKAGQIAGLKLQVEFVLQPAFKDSDGKTQRAIKYVADFVYCEDEHLVIEDVKSPATRENAVYKLKKKMMAYRGYKIREV
jgi:hypothetical protein